VANRQSALEALAVREGQIVVDSSFWRHKKVLITGHTGFKGSWLCLWLHLLGAKITGYALQPPTDPSLYEICRIDELIASLIGDIRDSERLTQALLAAAPEIVIHMAAQSLVNRSFDHPVETYATNVMGTVNLLEALRHVPSVKAAIVVTSDKCYQNNEWRWGYRENEALGGYDPYSSSKACAELVTAAYRNSFFSAPDTEGIAVATARAGNVIGGGDWAPGRLIPDCIRAMLREDPLRLRHPNAVRPWQHVLEPLSGYLMLAQALYQEGCRYAGAWNFGPDDSDARPVGWIVNYLSTNGNITKNIEIVQDALFHEATFLKLDSTKARTELRWQPRWRLEQALDKVLEWLIAYRSGLDVREVCFRQINDYCHPEPQSEMIGHG
jgi:CDP-glucose 4,6-dehydratase